MVSEGSDNEGLDTRRAFERKSARCQIQGPHRQYHSRYEFKASIDDYCRGTILIGLRGSRPRPPAGRTFAPIGVNIEATCLRSLHNRRLAHG